MCFNMILINKEKGIKRYSNAFYQSLLGKMLTNNDGFAFYYYNPFRSPRLIRTLSIYKALDTLLKLNLYQCAHLHFRKATMGAISLDNVHLWLRAGFYVSHNGHILGLYHLDRRYDPRSDTKRFLDRFDVIEALRKRDFNMLWDIMKKVDFQGIMFMNNKDFTEIYIIALGNKPIMYKNDHMIIIANQYLPHLKMSMQYISWGVHKLEIENMEIKTIIKEKELLDLRYDWRDIWGNNWWKKYTKTSCDYEKSDKEKTDLDIIFLD